MPIPLLVWGAIAAGGAALGWAKRDKIKQVLESEGGREFVRDLAKGVENFTIANFDPEVKSKMQRHYDSLIEIEPVARPILWPRYLKNLEANDAEHLRNFCSLRIAESNVGDDQYNNASAIKSTIESMAG